MKATDTSVGTSQYHKKRIQPWHIWSALRLNPWRADMVKRILRVKEPELDRQKIIHIATYLLENPQDDWRSDDFIEIDLSGIKDEYALDDTMIGVLIDVLAYPIQGSVESRERQLNQIRSVLWKK